MKITPQDVITTVKKLMLISASIHMVILIVYATQTGNIGVLNFFRILQIDLFFPPILTIPSVDLIAFLTLVIIFLVLLFLSIRKKNS